jgi:HAAS
MTDDGEPIRQYLDQLRLSLRIPEVGRILVEAEDHLRAATADGVAGGLTEREAQRAAIARFGPVSAIVYAHQTRHGRVAAMLADLVFAAWRVAAYLLLALFVAGGLEDLPRLHPAATPGDDLSWAVPGACGVVLLVAFYVIQHVRRRGGRVWSVPLGGFFALAAAGAAGLVAAGCVVLLSTHVATGKAGLAVGVIGYLCLGLVITYGARMVRMLRDQAREPGELA